jgi:hypothetical protein
MNEMACSYCLERRLSCGPKFTDADLMAMGSPLWNGLNVSWEVIESRYEMGKTLGNGSYADVMEVRLQMFNISEQR